MWFVYKVMCTTVLVLMLYSLCQSKLALAVRVPGLDCDQLSTPSVPDVSVLARLLSHVLFGG